MSEEPTAPGRAAAPAGRLQLSSESFDLRTAVGGWRGLAESIVPGLVFVVVYLVTRSLGPALGAALGAAGIAAIARLVQRSPLTQALGGLLGVAIGVVWAWRSGDAADFFVWGLWVNAAYLVATLGSILVRWPLVGILMGVLHGDVSGWRSWPGAARFVAATWVWVALFAARLAVQVPAWAAGDVGVLGVARLAMGVPLMALAAYLTWVLVRGVGPETDELVAGRT